MRKALVPIAVAAALGLSGCASMQEPHVAAPAAWGGSVPVSETVPVPALPDATWWRNFRSDELNALIAEAQTNNYSLKAAVARILQSKASARIAGAALYPSVSAGGGASRSVRQVIGPDIDSTSYSASLQASYQLDLFGDVRNSVASAGKRLESSLYDGETVAITLVTNVITAYFQVLSARERQYFAGERLKNAEEILSLLETQRRVGVLSELELAQQRAALNSQRAQIPGLRLAERQALDALAVLLGRNPQGFDVQAKGLSELVIPVIDAGIPSTLLVRRPDLRSAEAALKAANFDVAAARAARFPSIQLTGSGGTSSAALSGLFTTGTYAYSFGGSVAETLFAGGRLQAQEQSARARFLEVAANYQQAVIAAFSDVEDALAAVTENGRQYTLIQAASREADLAYRLAQLRYRAGAVDFQTVLNAQNSAFSAQESVVQSSLTRFTAAVGLAQALGGGWDGAMPDAPSNDVLYD
jgi:multidrug efflux system outer membrane protein